MSDVSLPKLGEVKLSDGRTVTVTRLPVGGLAAVRDAVKGHDIAGLFSKVGKAEEGEGQVQAQARVGVDMFMAVPEVLTAFMKWTVTEDGKGIPSSDEFINSIPAADIVKIAELSKKDVVEIVEMVKNLLRPVTETGTGQTPTQ